MPDPYIGEIRMFGGRFAPPGWLLCDGRELPINGEYAALYSSAPRTAVVRIPSCCPTCARHRPAKSGRRRPSVSLSRLPVGHQPKHQTLGQDLRSTADRTLKSLPPRS
ncbi:MAG: phage tail protein [Gemmatimonadota bacterium]